MWNKFVDKLAQLQQDRDTDIALLLNPRLEKLPLAATRRDDPFFPFSKEIIQATQDLVCAYVFDLASYLSIGAAGAVALERSIRYAATESLTILHAPLIGTGYSALTDATGFGVNAITIADAAELSHYITHPPYAAFITQDTDADFSTLPKQGGVYWVNEGIFALRKGNNTLKMRLTGDDILYANMLDDYIHATRAAVKALR